MRPVQISETGKYFSPGMLLSVSSAGSMSIGTSAKKLSKAWSVTYSKKCETVAESSSKTCLRDSKTKLKAFEMNMKAMFDGQMKNMKGLGTTMRKRRAAKKIKIGPRHIDNMDDSDESDCEIMRLSDDGDVE